MKYFLSDPVPRPVFDFRFLPQNPSMSKKTLSREEMEIHQVLSPASGHQGGSVQPQQTPPTGKPQPQSQTLSLGDLSALIKDSVVSGVQQGLNIDSFNNLCKALENANSIKNSNNVENVVYSKRPRLSTQGYESDNDLPRVGLDTVQEDTAPPQEVFGANINESDNEIEESDTLESEGEVPILNPIAEILPTLILRRHWIS